MLKRLSGWGRYPDALCEWVQPRDVQAGALALAEFSGAIGRGNGRSYGDAALNPGGTIDLRLLDHLIDFDAQSCMLTCEAGVMLNEIVDAFLPRGLFPMVTPGTSLVTVGGMIASDVHGKNHHLAGSFCDHVDWFDLMISPGEVLRCSRSENRALFEASCGGMGLTGLILRARFRLQPVESAFVRQKTVHAPDLAAAMALFEEHLDWPYSVAWIDCLAGASSAGRSVVFLGEHARTVDLPEAAQRASAVRPTPKALHVPIDLPNFVLGRSAVRAFNWAYRLAQRAGEHIIDADRYFYPLDAIHDWNRIYGKRGLLQYQCVIPLASSEAALRELLDVIRGGDASFLAVLKRMGAGSAGMLSFPIEGYTLALDFPAKPASLALLDRLDRITAAYGGRIYLAKDARAGPAAIAAGYPRLDEFRQIRQQLGLDRRFTSLLSRRLEI
jgi:decaprenylphospho-beta-D-ribofuranose 2-oxidase